MIIKLRLQSGPRISRTKGKNRNVASAAAALLWPAVLSAYVVGAWALGSEIRIAGAFGITRGTFSHWQVWFASAVSLHLIAVCLNQYGRGGELRFPIQIFSWLAHFGHRRAG